MATIRSYTTVEQSRKLAEFLPLESADFHFSANQSPQGYLEKPIWGNPEYADYSAFPCWSLAALINVLPSHFYDETGSKSFGLVKGDHIYGVFFESKKAFIQTTADNPVNACYEMILKLHELKLL